MLALTTLTIRLLGETYTLARGGAVVGLVGSLLIATVLIASAWSIGHAVGTPGSVFQSIGRSKGLWLTAMLVLVAGGDAVTIVVVFYYLLRVRAQLNVAARTRSPLRS